VNGRHYARCFAGIATREALRFVQQRERFIAALVRPLVWLVVFAAGFRSVLGVAILPPYDTYITYDVYIVPGLVGMIQLFNGMQSAGTLVSILQVYAFLAVAWMFDIRMAPLGYLVLLPVLVATGLMLGSLGMLLSSVIKQLENFAGIMNFVIFPMFFLSSALYPLWKMQETSLLLYRVCAVNPFTHAIEAIRFALYGQFNGAAVLLVLLTLGILLALAIYGYNPARGMMSRKGGGD